MLVIAHRGYHAAAPENTLAAFKAAAALGVDGIETDVRLSLDGLPVLVHDRITAGGQAIAYLTRSEIEQALDHAVPTLDEALEQFPDLLWNVEIKTVEALPAAIRVLEKYQARSRLLVTSFRHDLVADCAAALKVDCGLLVAHRPRTLASLLADFRGIEEVGHIVWDYNILDGVLLQQATAAGFSNIVYGAVTEAEHDYCRELGVVAVITDHPLLAQPARPCRASS